MVHDMLAASGPVFEMSASNTMLSDFPRHLHVVCNTFDLLCTLILNEVRPQLHNTGLTLE